jgi:hypothetical protein
MGTQWGYVGSDNSLVRRAFASGLLIYMCMLSVHCQGNISGLIA